MVSCRLATSAFAVRLTVASTSLWFGGQRLFGVAPAVQLGGVVSIFTVSVVRGLVFPATSVAFAQKVRVPCGRVMSV